MSNYKFREQKKSNRIKYVERYTVRCPQCGYFSLAGCIKKYYKNGDVGYYCFNCGCLFAGDGKSIIRVGKKKDE